VAAVPDDDPVSVNVEVSPTGITAPPSPFPVTEVGCAVGVVVGEVAGVVGFVVAGGCRIAVIAAAALARSDAGSGTYPAGSCPFATPGVCPAPVVNFKKAA
jgi:hypothetical protein